MARLRQSSGSGDVAYRTLIIHRSWIAERGLFSAAFEMPARNHWRRRSRSSGSRICSDRDFERWRRTGTTPQHQIGTVLGELRW